MLVREREVQFNFIYSRLNIMIINTEWIIELISLNLFKH